MRGSKIAGWKCRTRIDDSSMVVRGAPGRSAHHEQKKGSGAMCAELAGASWLSGFHWSLYQEKRTFDLGQTWWVLRGLKVSAPEGKLMLTIRYAEALKFDWYDLYGQPAQMFRRGINLQKHRVYKLGRGNLLTHGFPSLQMCFRASRSLRCPLTGSIARSDSRQWAKVPRPPIPR